MAYYVVKREIVITRREREKREREKCVCVCVCDLHTRISLCIRERQRETEKERFERETPCGATGCGRTYVRRAAGCVWCPAALIHFISTHNTEITVVSTLASLVVLWICRCHWRKPYVLLSPKECTGTILNEKR